MKTVKYLLFVCLFCLVSTSFATENPKRGWQLDLKRLGLNLTSTNVKNAKTYEGFSDTRLTSDSQTLIQGALNFRGDYFGNHYFWSNGVLAEYGKSTIEQTDGEKITTESVDRIIFDTAYTLRCWNVKDFLGGFEAGPYLSAAYETEFNSTGNAPLKKIVRGEGGAKLFEGKYLKSLFAAALAEADYTYPEESTKYGWTAGFDVEVPVREGVKATFKAIWRDYLHETKKQSTDLDYSLELDARMEVLVWQNLAIAPFINYFTAQGKYVGPRGQNLYVGIAFSFSKLFLEAVPPPAEIEATAEEPVLPNN